MCNFPIFVYQASFDWWNQLLCLGSTASAVCKLLESCLFMRYPHPPLKVSSRSQPHHRRASKLHRMGRVDEAEAVRALQHAQAAEAIYRLIARLQGFYVKLGQIVACKTDMLPR